MSSSIFVVKVGDLSRLEFRNMKPKLYFRDY